MKALFQCRFNQIAILNSLLNESRSRLSHVRCRSVRPNNEMARRKLDQMLLDMTDCSPFGPRLFLCKLSAVRKCSIASLK